MKSVSTRTKIPALLASAFVLASALPVHAQIVSGVMTVTGAEMH